MLRLIRRMDSKEILIIHMVSVFYVRKLEENVTHVNISMSEMIQC